MEHALTHAVASNGYLAVFLLMALSSACIPIPSEIVMLFGGALASATFAATQHVQPLSFVAVSLIGVAGSMVGSWAAYGVGYAGGRPLIDRWGRYLLLRPNEVERAHAWFEKHAPVAAIVICGALAGAVLALWIGQWTMDARVRSFLFTRLLGPSTVALDHPSSANRLAIPPGHPCDDD